MAQYNGIKIQNYKKLSIMNDRKINNLSTFIEKSKMHSKNLE
jgi:hypothetical protein